MSHTTHVENPHWHAESDHKWLEISECEAHKSAHISAKAMNITWGNDPRFWLWVDLPETESSFKVGVELVQVSWIEVRGKLDLATLKVSRPTWYEITYRVKFKPDSFGWDHAPITFEAGTTHTGKHTKSVVLKPHRDVHDKWHEVNGGCVEIKPDMVGYLEFGMLEVETRWWKAGMVLESVKIEPRIK